MIVQRHLYTPREAAQMMGVSYPTIKKCILDGKLRTTKTPGGHHRITKEDINAFLERDSGEPQPAPEGAPRISGVSQLRGEVVSVEFSGLVAEIILSIGDQRTRAIISTAAAMELDLKPGDKAAALFRSMNVMIGRFAK